MAREFIPSEQQSDFFDWIDDGLGNLILEAVAGAGKTTTLIEGLRRMRGSIFFGAFNKKISAEIKAKAEAASLRRQGLFISTMHGAGYSCWARLCGAHLVVDENKLDVIIDGMMNPDGAMLTPFIKRMVGYGKQQLIGIKHDFANVALWQEIYDHFSMDEHLPDGADYRSAMNLMIKVFKRSVETAKTIIDYDDMIYAPLYYRAKFYQNDWVLLDEGQDTNDARREMARRMLKPSGRLVVVGDRHQAIYQFTGANANALELIATEFHCARLPLTVSYRCPQAVVRHAHRWVRHIEWHPDAPEGVVRMVAPIPDPIEGRARLLWHETDTPTADDAVLCRYNAPLVKTAYAMLKVGHACRMEGRDIGKGLIALAKRWKVKSLDALENKLKAWQEKEVAKARAAKSEAKEQAVVDKVECLMVFVDRCRLQGAHSVDCVVKAIDDLFGDDVKGVTVLSSIHKSKGREWPRVYWLQMAVRSKRELKDWEEECERNLNYVATTRAMSELVLVPENMVAP